MHLFVPSLSLFVFLNAQSRSLPPHTSIRSCRSQIIRACPQRHINRLHLGVAPLCLRVLRLTRRVLSLCLRVLSLCHRVLFLCHRTLSLCHCTLSLCLRTLSLCHRILSLCHRALSLCLDVLPHPTCPTSLPPRPASPNSSSTSPPRRPASANLSSLAAHICRSAHVFLSARRLWPRPAPRPTLHNADPMLTHADIMLPLCCHCAGAGRPRPDPLPPLPRPTRRM